MRAFLALLVKGAQCVYVQDEVRKDLITATAASSLIACFVMGALANMPLAISAGMGLNAYLAYQVVGYCKASFLHHPATLAGGAIRIASLQCPLPFNST